jgi:transcriptional regulator with XRE-family HTH domain
MRALLDAAGLRYALATRGMTQAELAATAGLTAATVSRCVNGHLANYTTIRKLARALTITPCLLGSDGIIATQREVATGSPTLATVAEGVNDSLAAL